MPHTPSERRLGLLTSWKEIANFLGKGVRTVQRWEATLGLPVIRPSDSRSGIVMAHPAELEAWVVNRRQRWHRNLDGHSKKEEDIRATFTACVQELRRYHKEVRELCDQVNVAQQSLSHEVDRLKFLWEEWNVIRGQSLHEEKPAPREENPARSTKVN
jgi:hypothetical protein